MKAQEVLFDLGSLIVWREWEQPMVNSMFGAYTQVNTHKSEYFWRDAGSPQGFGPFPDLYTTMSHYKDVVKKFKNNRNEANNPTVGDLIPVDFLAKKRHRFDSDGI